MNGSGRGEQITERRPPRRRLLFPVTDRIIQSTAEPRPTEAVQDKVGRVADQRQDIAGALEETTFPEETGMMEQLTT